MKQQAEEAVDNPKGSSHGTLSYMSLVLSICIFLAVIGGIGYLIYASSSIQDQIQNTNKSVADKSVAIKKLQDDHAIRAYQAYEGAALDINTAIERSEAQRYIAELMQISNTYNIIFSGFNFTGNKISTSATSNSVLGDSPTEKIAKFIYDYRQPDTFNSHLFLLGPVFGVSGTEERRTFSVDFTVNPLFDMNPTATGSTATGSTSVMKTSTSKTSVMPTVPLNSAPSETGSDMSGSTDSGSTSTGSTTTLTGGMFHPNNHKK